MGMNLTKKTGVMAPVLCTLTLVTLSFRCFRFSFSKSYRLLEL